MNDMKFPNINARLLTGQKLDLPEDVWGRVALILLALVRQEPGLVDAWVDPFREVSESTGGLTFYRIALLGDSTIPNIVDLGMKMGIPAAKHGWTATAYGQRERVQQELDINDKESLHLYLLDREGFIRWAGQGAPGPEAVGDLLRAVRETVRIGGNSGPKGA